MSRFHQRAYCFFHSSNLLCLCLSSAFAVQKPHMSLLMNLSPTKLDGFMLQLNQPFCGSIGTPKLGRHSRFWLNPSRVSSKQVRFLHAFTTHLTFFLLNQILQRFAETNPQILVGQVFETRRMELLRDIREVNSAIRAAELRKRRKPLVSSIFRI